MRGRLFFSLQLLLLGVLAFASFEKPHVPALDLSAVHGAASSDHGHLSPPPSPHAATTPHPAHQERPAVPKLDDFEPQPRKSLPDAKALYKENAAEWKTESDAFQEQLKAHNLKYPTNKLVAVFKTLRVPGVPPISFRFYHSEHPPTPEMLAGSEGVEYVPFDKAFAEGTLAHIEELLKKPQFLASLPQAVKDHLVSLSVEIAPIPGYSVSRVISPDARKTSYVGQILIGRRAFEKVTACPPADRFVRSDLVADQYDVAAHNGGHSRPAAFFFHEFAHAVMMISATSHYLDMVNTCVKLTKLYADPIGGDTFNSDWSAALTKLGLTPPTDYRGPNYSDRVHAYIGKYANEKYQICGFLELIPEVWSGALLGMPLDPWVTALFAKLVPPTAMPLPNVPPLAGWCPQTALPPQGPLPPIPTPPLNTKVDKPQKKRRLGVFGGKKKKF